MADVNIHELDEAAASTAADLFEVYQPGETAGTRNRRIPQGRLWRRAVINRSGSHTLVAADEARYQRFNAGGGQTLTLPAATAGIDSGVYVLNAEYRITKVTSGELTLSLGSGVTVNPPKGGIATAETGDRFALVVVEVSTGVAVLDWIGSSKDAP